MFKSVEFSAGGSFCKAPALLLQTRGETVRVKWQILQLRVYSNLKLITSFSNQEQIAVRSYVPGPKLGSLNAASYGTADVVQLFRLKYSLLGFVCGREADRI